MTQSFDEWFDRFVRRMDKQLSPFPAPNDGKGKKRPTRGFYRCWRYYVDTPERPLHFVVHLRAVPTKARANVQLGLSQTRLHVPDGCPPLRYVDDAHKYNRQFDINMGDDELEWMALHLAVQVATIVASLKSPDQPE